ncbi:hypothetical protein ACSBLW_18140 [Thioclava sp. FR2]|uniref:hypothetical protein n=1 Tax=Thioclava sp. FR2 TaxID=3445780 RepID=UPI003EB833AC
MRRYLASVKEAGLGLALSLILSACQLPLANGDTVDGGVNPITGGAVETTSLDAAPATDTPADVAKPKSDDGGNEKPADMPTPKPRPVVDPAKTKDAPEPAKLDQAPAPPAPTPAAAAPKSASQLACEKAKGVWTLAGSGSAAFCQKPTRDGGKLCRASTDCEGYCLARSRTCAPITPMFGCQDILNEDGRMLTQCID